MKRYLSLVMALLLVFGTMTTSFAADLDFINNDDPTKSYSFNEIVKSPTKLIEVAGNLGDYAIEWDGKLYSASEVEALTAGGDTFEEAIAKLDPIEEEPPVVDEERWSILLDTTAVDDTIIANGDDNTTVIIKIVDEDGVVQKVNGIVIELTTSHGSLASAGKLQRVTLQNGMGTIKLNSEYSATPIAAKLTAKLYEAALEYQELIGQKEVTFPVFFRPLGLESLEAPPVLLAAESNQADRVTIYFDKEVDIEAFEEALENGDLDIDVSQEWMGTYLDPVGFLPVQGNNKAIVAVLEVDYYDYILRDNTWTEVWIEMESDYGEIEKSVWFLLTDARQPELVEVTVEEDSMREIRLKFSESISDIQSIIIDGGLVDIADWDIDTFEPAYWKLDGTFVPFKDYRNFVDVEIDGWLTEGEHSVTVTKAADWAGVTDPKNVSTTQTLDFTIGENTAKPTVTARVESPEQIRMYFDSNVEFVEEEYGVNWMLEYNTGTTATPNWITVPTGLISTFDEVNQVVLEADLDWTRYFDTENTEDNYYNFKWRLHADAGVLINTKNGELNDEINIDLNYSGSPLNSEDVTSPRNLYVEQVDEGVYEFDIAMDEPVKYRDTQDGIDTPSQEQGSDIPYVLVEFIGKNSAGTTVTIPGAVINYGDEYSKDMVIRVGEATSLQNLVDDEGYAESWTLNVKNITDDVGNAAETVVWNFTVPKTGDEDPDTQDFWIDYAEFTTDGAIRVQFTDLIKTSGGSESAVLLSNYSVNNQDLPAGTIIEVDQSSATTMGGLEGYTAVYILLGEGFEPARENTLEVAKTLKSKDGDPLKGFDEYPEFTRYQDVIDGEFEPTPAP